MSTSGNINLTTTRNEIIQEAMELLGVIEPGVTPSDANITSAARTFNFLIKAWQTDGLNVFTVKEGFLFTIQGQTQYTLSDTGDLWTYDFDQYTLLADAASGSFNITIEDASDIVVGGFIGVALDTTDDDTGVGVLWTTVQATDNVQSIILADSLPGDASAGNTVMFFEEKADEPLRGVECSLRNESGNTRPIDFISRQEWNELSNKTYSGKVTQVYWDTRVTPPVVYAWPQSSENFDILTFWVKRITETFNAADDNPDFPQQWFYPLATGLAVAIGPKFGVPSTNKNFAEIKRQAGLWYEMGKGFDATPEESVRFEVDTSGG